MSPSWNMRIEDFEGNFLEMEYVGSEEMARSFAKNLLELVLDWTKNMKSMVIVTEVNGSPSFIID